MLGGIVPVPVALGISDEHKHKLLRIAKKLGTPFIYTDRKTLDRIGAFAARAGEAGRPSTACAARAFLVDQLDDISQRRRRCTRVEAATTRRSSSSPPARPASPRASCSRIATSSRTRAARRGGRLERARLDRSRWMPLTHDMGLIGLHMMMFAHRMQHAPDADRAVRPAPVAVADVRVAQAGHDHLLAELRLPALPEGAGRSRRSATSTSPRCACIFNGAEPISVELPRNSSTRLAPRSCGARRCFRCTASPRPRWR